MNRYLPIYISLFCVHSMCAMDQSTEKDPLLSDISTTILHTIQATHDQAQGLSRKTLADLTVQDWKKGPVDTLDLSKQELVCVDDMKSYCNRVPLLHGPPLIDCAQITKLNLSHNKIEKLIVPILQFLENVTWCDLSHNKFEGGDIGAFFQAWPNLTYLNIGYNKIKDGTIVWRPDHSSFNIVAPQGSQAILPEIHLEGNQIYSDKTKKWLIERYKQELNRSADLINMTDCGGCAIGVIGAGIGAGAIGLPIWIKLGSCLGLYAGPPTGCALGCLIGLYVSIHQTRDTIKEHIMTMKVPVYFQDNEKIITHCLQIPGIGTAHREIYQFGEQKVKGDNVL